MLKLLIFLLLSTASAYALDCDPMKPKTYAECLKQFEELISGPQINCDAKPHQSRPKNICEKKNTQLFADGVLNVTYAGGYFDGAPGDGVFGEYWNNKLKETLTNPCPSSFQLMSNSERGGADEKDKRMMKAERENGCGKPLQYQQTCGFTRSDDPEIFLKKIVISGKAKTIKLRILTSSIFDSNKKNLETMRSLAEKRICALTAETDKKNCVKKNTPPKLSLEKLKEFCRRGDEYLYQPCRSAYVRNAWKNSILNGDEMVIYDGHARDGGGPSFDPPQTLANGHVDYPWYRKNRPGHVEEAGAFEEAQRRGKSPAIYMSLSCNSHLHFMKRGRFPVVSPDTSYVLSKRSAWGDEGVAAFLSTLEGVVTNKCGSELDKSVTGASCAFGVYNH